MKLLLVAAFLTTSALANHHEDKTKTLEEIKARITTNINERIAAQQKHLACVQGAATKEALKACQDSNREAMKKMRGENKGERREWKEKRREEKKK